MRAFVLLPILVFILEACDRPVIRPKGSDQDWQQRQEQMDKDKSQELERLDPVREREEDMREVNIDPYPQAS